ncbi:tetratricopeptide (TPR) repeat protein [Lipingzhangella halophila]|uniref:Tetratricopeptide (TPR) repeat protein n=1 Tax=Lipingzhangella halophila TaxID=1783352 RepID=A0A7W7REA4_9ACTN|nr:tetratricopeptide repeat protein [Lipingzhangella halophila]MBB4929831.1 tetratricopeptide (TPR) repeat protein [Lipingzhangella halophila]
MHVHNHQPSHVPRQLPPLSEGIVDRDRQRAEIGAVVARVGTTGRPVLLVVHGSYGSGRTTLALDRINEFVGRFDHGQVYAEFGGIGPGNATDPGAVIDDFLHEMNVDLSEIKHDEKAKHKRFRSLTANRRILFFLEDVVSASQVWTLVPNSPDAMVVATSTSAARLSGLRRDAEMIEVSPMDDAHIREVLVSRVGGDDPRPAAEPRAMDALVRLCGGLPLLAVLSADRLAADAGKSVAALVEEVREHGASRALEPHKDEELPSLRPFLDASYANLTGEEARIYRAMGTHPVPEADVWLVAGLLGTDLKSAERPLANLVRVGLMVNLPGHRYRLREPFHFHKHAADMAHDDASAAERSAARDWFARYYLAGAHAAGERLNLRARYGDLPPGLDGIALPDFTGTLCDAGYGLRDAELKAPDDPPPARWVRDTLPAVIGLARQAVENAGTAAGPHGWVYRVAMATDWFFRAHGHTTERFELVELGVHDARACGDAGAVAYLNLQWGLAYYDHEEHANALAKFEQALEWALELDDRDADTWYPMGAALEGVGLATWRLGRPADALASLRRSYEYFVRLDRARSLGLSLMHQGAVRTDLGHPDEALAFLERSRAAFLRLAAEGRRDQVNEAKVLLRVSAALILAGRRGEAADAAERARRVFRSLGRPLEEGQALEARAGTEADPRERARRLRAAREHFAGNQFAKAVERVDEKLAELDDQEDG